MGAKCTHDIFMYLVLLIVDSNSQNSKTATVCCSFALILLHLLSSQAQFIC